MRNQRGTAAVTTTDHARGLAQRLLHGKQCHEVLFACC